MSKLWHVFWGRRGDGSKSFKTHSDLPKCSPCGDCLASICWWASLPNSARTRDANHRLLSGETTLTVPSPAIPDAEPYREYRSANRLSYGCQRQAGALVPTRPFWTHAESSNTEVMLSPEHEMELHVREASCTHRSHEWG